MRLSELKVKNKVKQKNYSFNESKILNDYFTPIQFDIKLTSNPFLKNQEKFQYLVAKIKEYNNQVAKSQIKDSYECMVYDRLFSLINTLNNMLSREIQKDRLDYIFQWFNKQEKLIIQRKNQGVIRYKITKNYLEQTDGIQHSPQLKKQVNYQKIDYKSMIPSEYIAKKNLPFLKNWRTAHKQLQTPDVRLNQYKSKNTNFGILQYTSQRQPKRAPRITYPKIQKHKYVRQYQVQQVPQQQNKNQGVALNPENPQSQLKPNEDIKKQQQKQPNQNAQNQAQKQQPGQDLGLGQQPNEQPQQQQQIQQQDKLAPKLKSYIHQPRNQTKDQYYSHKRMNERYIKYQNDFIRKQNEDSQVIQLMHSWAAKKSQLDKQVIKRIQNMGLNYKKYKLSYEDPQKQEAFSIQDANKYGLNKTFDLRNNKVDIDISLPEIKSNSQIYEKSIRKDKLNSLKKRFGKMLDLKDYEQREVSQSLCQIEVKKKGFSQILRKHSKSKQRMKQLQQVILLKQKLASEKIQIDMTKLSASLCAPQDEQNLPENVIPAKNLLSNPFWVEPAKKKKKKK